MDPVVPPPGDDHAARALGLGPRAVAGAQRLQRQEYAQIRAFALQRGAEGVQVVARRIARFDLRHRQAVLRLLSVLTLDEAHSPVDPAVADLPRVGVKAFEPRDGPGLELEAAAFGQVARGVQAGRRANHARCRSQRAEALLHQPHGQMRDVDADPAAVEVLRGDYRSAAAAERIEHQIALVRRRLDNSLEQRERLLRLEARRFGGLLVERRDVVPEIRERLPRVGVQVALDVGHPAGLVWPVDQVRLRQRVQPLVDALHALIAGDQLAIDELGVGAPLGHRPAAARREDVVAAPGLGARHAAPLVVQRAGQVAVPVPPSLIFVAVVAGDVFRIERHPHIVGPNALPAVEEQQVADVPEG